MMTNKWLSAGALMVGILTAGTMASAGGKGDCGCDKAMKGLHGKRMLQSLDLDAETKDKLKALWQTQHTAMAEAHKQLKVKRGELYLALSAAALDQTKINALGDEASMLMTAKMKSHVEHMSAVSALLTAGQRQTYFAMMKKHHRKMHKGAKAEK